MLGVEKGGLEDSNKKYGFGGNKTDAGVVVEVVVIKGTICC